MKNKNKTKTKLQFIKPFIYIRPSISSVVIRMLVLLSIQVLMLLFTKSYSAVAVVISALLGSACAASLNYLIYHEPPFQILSIIVQGLMIGMMLPENYPLVSVFFITFATLFISRCLIFKSINSWINVCSVAIIAAWFIGKKYFPQFTITSDLVSLRNSSQYLIQNGTFPVLPIDSTITNFLNSTIFSWFKVSIPEGYISLLWDTHSAIPAFRFNILTILSSIIIFSDKSFSGIIPVLFLTVYALLVRLFCPMMLSGYFNQGDMILALTSSGVLFYAVFLVQWYGTVPVTIAGKNILGIISGILAFFIIGCGTSPIGMPYTLLITNIVSIFIKSFEEKNNLLKTSKIATAFASKGEK